MMNIEKKIEEAKKRLEDARERQIDFDLDAEWNEDLDDLTAPSVQLMEAHTDEVEALERQLEWLQHINRRTKLEDKISKRYFKPLDEVEERELVVKDFLKVADRDERDDLARLLVDLKEQRNVLIEKMEMMA